MIYRSDTTVFRVPGAKKAVVYRKNDSPAMHPSGEDETLRRLKNRDAHVKAHEASHAGSGGVMTIGAPSYTYQIGPDGKPYAIGGKVTLASRPASNPRMAELHARSLKNASLSVDDPSPQDLAAASSAEAMAREARIAAASYKQQEEQQYSKLPNEKKGSEFNQFA